MSEGAVDVDEMYRFVDDYLAGKVKPSYKSQPPPIPGSYQVTFEPQTLNPKTLNLAPINPPPRAATG
jgi:hypothetical protein